ncbi:MAG TPA: MBL fold metallo-hydrolase, partial [Bacteroidia bacterium]|nr:MBL fold metallo-hydrolase [Bacteroidia bacterium]
MYIQQLYTGCLSEAAYYIESEGEAAIIDPLRETAPYTEIANQRNAKIKYVFETHFHADFVSGHIDLAAKTGAKIIFGPDAHPAYKAVIAKENEVFTIGKIKIKVLHTPGHTLESSCYLLFDENDKPNAIFTGDTLFVGDVGRPDLSQKSDLTKNDLAGMMYESLKKLKALPNDVIVYPAHGAGSACGKNI